MYAVLLGRLLVFAWAFDARALCVALSLRTVLAKCYGGDISRKRKLLDKQKKGKKRLRAFGKVNMPQEAFMAIVAVDRSGPSTRN